MPRTATDANRSTTNESLTDEIHRDLAVRSTSTTYRDTVFQRVSQRSEGEGEAACGDDKGGAGADHAACAICRSRPESLERSAVVTPDLATPL